MSTVWAPRAGRAVTQALYCSLNATHRPSGEIDASSARVNRRCVRLSVPSSCAETSTLFGGFGPVASASSSQ